MHTTSSLDQDGYLANVRITPKKLSEEEPDEHSLNQGNDGNGHGKKGKIQNFQRLDNTNVLVGYVDEDLDMSNAPAFGDIALPEDDAEIEGNGGNTRRRRTQASNTVVPFGKTCTAWDWLDVRIATDKKFKNSYEDHTSRAQAVFAEAAEIYWKESCVSLYMWSYESTVGNSNWVTPFFGWSWDFMVTFSHESGCPDSNQVPKFGALQILQSTVNVRQYNAYRDAWHMFSGVNFSRTTIGCAYFNPCKSKLFGFGVNEITFNTNLHLQAVLFAHELGHNMGLRHLSSTAGNWIMEPNINFAPYGFTDTNADSVKDKVVYISGCGWY